MMNHHITNTKYEKERTTLIFFESFNVPYFYSCPNQLLGLYSSGRINGIVVDSGHTFNTVVPVFEGSSLNYAHLSSRLAGELLTEKIKEKFDLNDQIATNLKERYLRCELAIDELNEEE